MGDRNRMFAALIALVLLMERGHANTPVGEAYVFFNADSYTLTPEAKSILDNFVAADRLNVTRPLFVEGGSDRSGSTAHDLRISCRRAFAVRRYLIEHGMSGKDLIVRKYGAVEPIAADTPPALRRARLRRVLVRYSGDEGRRLFEWGQGTPGTCR